MFIMKIFLLLYFYYLVASEHHYRDCLDFEQILLACSSLIMALFSGAFKKNEGKCKLTGTTTSSGKLSIMLNFECPKDAENVVKGQGREASLGTYQTEIIENFC